MTRKKLIELIVKTTIPVIICCGNNYSDASKLNQMIVEMWADDSDKISIIKNSVTEYVDLKTIR